MHPVTLHIIYGELAVNLMRAGIIDNQVRIAHAVYDFHSSAESEAFLLGMKESFRDTNKWMTVSNPADIHRLGRPMKSRLFDAIERGDAAAVDDVLRAGLNPDARDQAGATALHVAARLGKLAVVQTLIEHGADVTATTEDAHRETPLHLIAHSKAPESLVDLLSGPDADLDPFNGHHETPLMKALKRDDLALALHLLRNGANLDYEDAAGNSARSIFVEKFAGVVDDPQVDAFSLEVGKLEDTPAEALTRARKPSYSPFSHV